MKHTHSISWVVLRGGVNVMEKWGVRIVSFILSTPRESLFFEPLVFYKRRSIGEVILPGSNILQ